MDNSIKFHVEGSLWSSELSLMMEYHYSFYRVRSSPFKQGDKKDYDSTRKFLYRHGVRLRSIIQELQNTGVFSVEISQNM